jgi:hypothetical protein
MSSFQPLALEQLLSGKSEPLRQLLTARYPSPCTAQHPQLPTTQVIDMLGQLQFSDKSSLTEIFTDTLEPTETIGSYEYAVLYFVDHLLSRHSQDNHLAEAINHSLKPLRALVASQILQNNTWPWDDQHPLQRCLHLIQRNCAGWDAKGIAAKRFIEKLNPLVAQLAAAKTIGDQQQCLSSLQAFFDHEQTRRKKLQQRICDSEQGILQARHAQRLAAKTLNQRMAGKKLPQTIVAFLKEHWLESLRLHILKVGEHADEWQQLIDLSTRFINSFQPELDNTERYQAIEELPDQLRSATISINHQSNKLEEQLALISAEHLKLLKNETLAYCEFELIDNSNPLTTTQAHISKGLLKTIEALQIDQWFIDYRDEGKPQRIQLILKLESENQLLFSNFAGTKSEQYSYEEFAYRLCSQRAFTLHMDLTISSSANKLLESLLKLHNQQQEKQAKEEVLLEQQRLEAQQKAQAEAEALARLEQERQEQQQREAALTEKKKQELQQQIDAEQKRDGQKEFQRLNIGALVEFLQTADAPQTLKLAVKLQSTGRHIFTDKTGIKKLDLGTDELLALFIKQQATIIRLGEEFESSLSKVVDGIRNNKR